MNIRQATTNDAASILQYLAAFWAAGCNTVIYRSSLPNLQDEINWLAQRDGEYGVVFVAEQDGKIIGLIDTIIPEIDEFKHTCEFGMSVLAAYRNKGIGRRLIQHLLNWANIKHISNVELNVFSNNHAAIALYASLGFVEDGRRKNAVRLQDGTFCDLIHMTRLG
jgi:RimJ/RimL family protein N-acetyltransferase